MTSANHARMHQLEEALSLAVQNIGLHLTTAENSSYPSAYQKIHNLVDYALLPLAQKLNKSRSVNQLPVELFESIAALLPLPDLYRAGLVCHGWRATLLGLPHLWKHLCFDQHSYIGPGPELLGILLARSQDVPLTLEYRCSVDFDEQVSADRYNGAAGAIMLHLHRVKSLSLNLPVIEHTDFERLLYCPAPLLECFRLHCVQDQNDCVVSLPGPLFDNQAHLKTLSLFHIYPPRLDDSCPSVLSVTHLVYEAHALDLDDLEGIFKFFPALQSLTIVGDDELTITVQGPRCPLPLQLRVAAIPHIGGIVNCFRDASSICMSASMRYVGNDRRVQDHLRAAARRRPPASVAISWRPLQCDPGYDCRPALRHSALGGLAISLDGEDVVVDLLRDAVLTTLERTWDELTRALRRLALPVELCCAVPAPPLGLDELTLYVRHPADRADWQERMWELPHAPGVGQMQAAPLLRIAVPPADARRFPDLDEQTFARSISVGDVPVVDLRAVRTLVLSGVGLTPSAVEAGGWLRALAPQAEVVVEPRQAGPPCEPWVWHLPKEGVIAL